MWLSDLLKLVALAAFAALASCGYTPAYAPGGPATALRQQVEVEPPSNQNEFDLVKQLELRLGRAEQPKYRLALDLTTRREGVGVTPAQEIVRFNIYGSVRYSLHDIQTGKILTSGTTDTFTSYSVGSVDVGATPPSTNATIATLAAESDAKARLMTVLADQIVTRLIATAGDWAK